MYQSSPTIVLELNHIKFELVPAQKGWFAGYSIPKGTGGWQSTDPNEFNQSLEYANKNNAFLVKPTIRLAKMWNAANGYPFESFEFEKWISERSFLFCRNQRDYLFDVFDGLSNLFIREQWKRERIERAKRIVKLVRDHERGERLPAAEREIARLIP